ncbi:MAG: diguanylate cyclase domain-containing protein [Acidimicrobiia bacterium]
MNEPDFAAFWRSSPDINAVTDWQGNVRECNETARRFGISPGARVPGLHRHAWVALVQVLAAARRHATVPRDVSGVALEGGVRTFSVAAYPVGVDRIAWVGHDVTADRRREATLAKTVGRDSLTGLPDRIVWRDRLDQALRRTRRSHKGVGLMYLDLDDFKQVNDQFGHAFGDEVLREVARRILGAMRPSDTVARLGGDEFVILCEDVPDVALLDELGDRVSRAIGQQPFSALGATTALTCSVGVTYADAVTTDIETFIRATDLAMYEAKRSGRGLQRRAEPESDIGQRAGMQRALANKTLPLRAQSITEHSGGALIGYAIEGAFAGARNAAALLRAVEEDPMYASALCQLELDVGLKLLETHEGATLQLRVPMRAVADPALIAALYRRVFDAGFDPKVLMLLIEPMGGRAERVLLELRRSGSPVQFALAAFGRYPIDLGVLEALAPQVCELDARLAAKHPLAFATAQQVVRSIGARVQCASGGELEVPAVDLIRWLPGELLQPAGMLTMKI